MIGIRRCPTIKTQHWIDPAFVLLQTINTVSTSARKKPGSSKINSQNRQISYQPNRWS